MHREVRVTKVFLQRERKPSAAGSETPAPACFSGQTGSRGFLSKSYNFSSASETCLPTFGIDR